MQEACEIAEIFSQQYFNSVFIEKLSSSKVVRRNCRAERSMMSYSVINGAIGKSPVIDKINQLTVEETGERVAAEMERQVCGGKGEKYPSLPISFPECKREIRNRLETYRKGRSDGNRNV